MSTIRLQEMTDDEREEVVGRLCHQIRTWVMSPNTEEVYCRVRAGTERHENLDTGFYDHRYNDTFSLELHINGGAQDTEGGPIP